MKTKIAMGLGMGAGFAVYELLRHGLEGADWYRAAFVALLSTILLLLLPSRWFERRKSYK